MESLILSHDDETIVALCTAPGNGALALLRLSGDQALSIADTFASLASGMKITAVASHTVHYGIVVDASGTHVDQVMFIVMRAPRTFTGQNTVEITCHNNPFIIQAIIHLAVNAGARLAQQGEFTKRALLNNKIDLLQAEALNELIHANTHLALKKSLSQLEGSFSSWITLLEKNLLKALAFSEASFEFIDEEMEFGGTIHAIISETLVMAQSIKKNFNQQQQIRQGVRIAIIGSVNAGKSSLFNALLNKERAIVTNIAGTTRDVIEAGLYKQTSYWTLIDTAGLRQTDDIIEQEGIVRSLAEAAQADIVLLVVDRSRVMTTQERTVYEELLLKYGSKTILLHNKCDLPLHPNGPLSCTDALDVSSKAQQTILRLEQNIEHKIEILLQTADAPFLLNQRQYNLVLGLEKKLEHIERMLTPPIQYELLSYHLNDALAQLTELTGKTISEQGMDAIFREFCVGK